MGEVAQHRQAQLDDGVRLLALDVGDEADAAGVVLVRWVVQTLGKRQAHGGTDKYTIIALQRQWLGGRARLRPRRAPRPDPGLPAPRTGASPAPPSCRRP